MSTPAKPALGGLGSGRGLESPATPASRSHPSISRGVGGDSGDGERDKLVCAVEGMRLLALKFTALIHTKLLLARQEAVALAASALELPPHMAAAGGGMGGPAGGHSRANTARDGQAAGGAAGTGSAGHRISPPAADSASSTLDAGHGVSIATYTQTLATLTTSFKAYSVTAQHWQRVSAGCRAFYQAAAARAGCTLPCTSAELEAQAAAVAADPAATVSGDAAHAAPPHNMGDSGAVQGAGAAAGAGSHEAGSKPGWVRLVHVLAAQLVGMGFEGGLWDLLGTVTVARQALDTVMQLVPDL